MSDPVDAAGPTVVVPLLEEEASVRKRERVTERVRVQALTDTIETVVHEQLAHDDVTIDRVACDRVVEAGSPVPQIRVEDGVTIIPVLEERLVVEKRLVLKEELRVVRRSTTEPVEVPVTLRRQHAAVERIAPAEPQSPEE